MFKELFGCDTAEKCLLYIKNYGEGHINGIAKCFNKTPSQIQSILHKLEAGGILVSGFTGNVRRFTFNPRLAIKDELFDLLERILMLTDEEETLIYYRQRRRPVHCYQRREADKNRQVLFKKDSGICSKCNEFDALWEADHIIPLSEGGIDDVSNLRTLCRSCHVKASNESRNRMYSYNSTLPIEYQDIGRKITD